MRLARISRYGKAESRRQQRAELHCGEGTTHYTRHMTSASMSLCETCRSIPFRKLIAGDADALRNAGFRFNEAGRTPSAFLDELCWNERRCAVTEIACLAKTCSLCAFILMTVKHHRWILVSTDKAVGWKKIKTLVPQSLTVWMELSNDHYGYPYLSISLGTASREATDWLNFTLRKSFGNSAMRLNIKR